MSRSATKGMRLYRVQRDDAYLRILLAVVSRLWREHVLPRRPPPPDLFKSWDTYHSRVRQTVAAARRATLLLAVAEGDLAAPPRADPRPFLD